MDRVTENHANDVNSASSIMHSEVYDASQRQGYPFQDAVPLMQGFSAGVIDESTAFIEFLSTPNAVSNSLVAIGPLLDTAVNYYGNHIPVGFASGRPKK